MKNRIAILSAGILLSLAICTAAKDIYKSRGVDILTTTSNSMTVRFQPQQIAIDTFRFENKTYLKPDFFCAAFDATPGNPILASLPVTIGIPVESNIDLTIIESDFTEFTGNILPQPNPQLVNGLTIQKYFENQSIYSVSKQLPGEIADISSPEFVRDQRIAQIRFRPIQYNPAQQKIRVYQSITVQINYSVNTVNTKKMLRPRRDDDLLENLLLNYDAAKSWRKSKAIRLQKQQSLFNSDHPWYKIHIVDEGIYKITGNDLGNYGIDIKSVDPRTLKIYNNGGTELERGLSKTVIENLTENAIIVEDGGDGVFDPLDYFLFYGKAVNNWSYNTFMSRYEHYINHYQDQNIYWLTWGGETEGKRMQEQASAPDPSAQTEPWFIDQIYFEKELNNFLNSGYNWYSRFFATDNTYKFTVNLENALTDEAYFRFKLVGITSNMHMFTIDVNNTRLTSYSTYVSKEIEIEQASSKVLQTGYNTVEIMYQSNRKDGQAYLDWFEIHYRKEFSAINDFLEFNLPPSENSRKITISDFTDNDIHIFDITDFANVKRLSNTEISGDQVSFSDNTDKGSRKRMIALSTTSFSVPDKIEKIEVSDLRNSANGADFIIIAHDDFYEAVLPLAQHRESHDNLTSIVVKISDVYNEFSFGLYDPAAIRNFIKYAYENWTIAPQYILLCGDGDYDYRNIINELDQNWIPPYETTETDEESNRTTDDWFVDIVSGNNKTIADLAIGRFPVQSAAETKILVDKIIQYETAPLTNANDSSTLDDWRNIVTIVGDDELVDGGEGNETIHTSDAEDIIEHYVPNSFNKQKIYLSEYPAVSNASYFSALLKPTAAKAIMDRINNGALVINYVGHGNPLTWSHEYVLYAPRDFNKIQNGSKLALWVAATCDFGRFDDPSQQSLAEDLLISENRGAIGILASTRLVYAHINAALNRAFYTRLFNGTSQTERLGTALLLAKMDNSSGTNDQKYVLLGDPTMRLRSPQYSAKITAITPDTIKALSRIKVSGQIMKNNTRWNDFQGKILMKAFDSKKHRIYQTESGSTLKYYLEGNTVFRGINQITNGEFNISFIVPKDITYGGHLGRINIYFSNNEVHGSGYRDSLLVGGTAQIQDYEGPEIKIGLKEQEFFDGAYTTEAPIIKLDIADSISGINITGDIGHNITMIVDDDIDNKIILTDFFQYKEGSFTNGEIIYDFNNYTSDSTQLEDTDSGKNQSGLSEGMHQLEIKAWDNSNNSSVARSQFQVIPQSTLKLNNVLNYPNPFASRTAFSFWANHNCRVTLKIYTVAGRLIHKFDEFYLSANELAKIDWDGRDKDGDPLANGVYFYKVRAKTDAFGDTKTDEVIEKLVIMR